jgi:hypothetical protein
MFFEFRKQEILLLPMMASIDKDSKKFQHALNMFQVQFLPGLSHTGDPLQDAKHHFDSFVLIS